VQVSPFSELTNCPAARRALFDRSENAAVAAALARADARRARDVAQDFGLHPDLLYAVQRRSDAAISADLYARECERQFVAATFSGASRA